tara:strand:- start:291 stop:692 length:402 start_codon:yes stop_codon:yes gene_type:complete
MNKGLKIALISLGLITSGVVLFRIFRGKTLEDNGKELNETEEQEEENTTGGNPIAVGDIIYPSGDYVNVRNSAMVNNGWINNIMLKINTPNAIGVVDDIMVADAHVWYKVQLNEDLTESAFGYVRSDVVTKTI